MSQYPSSLRRLCVLWVDDDRHVVDASKRLLEARGLDVTMALCGSDALAFARAREYDVAILDQRMPEISGVDVLALLRAARNRTPVMFLTACATVGLEHEAKSLGAVKFYQKPLTGDDLVDAIYSTIACAGERDGHAVLTLDEEEQAAINQREDIARLRYLLVQLEDTEAQRRAVLAQLPETQRRFAARKPEDVRAALRVVHRRSPHTDE
jgi:FixJ family two-component response regulator